MDAVLAIPCNSRRILPGTWQHQPGCITPIVVIGMGAWMRKQLEAHFSFLLPGSSALITHNTASVLLQGVTVAVYRELPGQHLGTCSPRTAEPHLKFKGKFLTML